MNAFIKASVLAVVTLSFTAGASAGTLKMRLTDLTNGGTVSITAEDLDNDGILLFSGSVGTFTFNVGTGISKPLNGNSTDLARLFLSSTTLTTALGGTLEILLTDTYDLSSSSSLNWTSQIGGVASGNIAASQFVDFDNNPFGTTGPNVASLSHLISSPGAFSDTQSQVIADPDGPFTITERVVVTLDPNSATTFDFVSTLTTAEILAPEPASSTLAVLACTIAGIGGWFARRRK